MRALVSRAGLDGEIEVCSAGIGDWHVGEHADPRSAEALTARGYDASNHRARQFQRDWFDEHDLVIAMDRSHLRDLRRMAGAADLSKVRLLTSFGPDATDEDVPDPYYGGPQGFTDVLVLVERYCAALLEDVRSRLHA